MIGYSCKYAPVELVAAYGEEALLLDAETADFSRAETLTHANVCCHAKALLTQALDTDELVLTDCCDATRRICDVLQDAGRQRFLFQFDLPHDDAACARARLTRELMPLRRRLRRVHGQGVFQRGVLRRLPESLAARIRRASRLSRCSARASAPSSSARFAVHSPSRWKT